MSVIRLLIKSSNMKQFKILLLLLLPIIGNTQNYISTSLAYQENFLVTPRYLRVNIINIYDSVIHHNTGERIKMYVITDKKDVKNEKVYRAWGDGTQYEITVKSNEIIFHKLFSNQYTIYYYEGY